MASTSDGDLRWLPDVPADLVSAARARVAVRESLSGVVVQSAQGEIVAANAAAEEMLGLSWRQLVGLTSMDPRWQAVSENGVPLPGERHPALVALATGRAVLSSLLGVIVPPEDRTAWLEVDAEPVPVPGSSRPEPMSGVVVFFTDVSSSPRGMRAFDSLVRAYRLLADNASDIIFRSDSRGRCEWVSPSVQTLTGWRADELIGRRMLDLVHPDDVGAVLGHREKVMAGSQEHYTVRMAQQDGTFRWVAARAHPHPAGTRTPRSAVIALRDVHEATLARARLAESERQYRMLIQNLSDIVVHVRDSAIEWISPSVEDVLGMRADHLIGREFEGFVLAEDRRAVQHMVITLAGGQATRSRVRLYAADARVRVFDVRGRPFVNEEGSTDGAIYALRDVTEESAERRRLEYLARHDETTGLMNWPTFRKHLTGLLEVRSVDGRGTGVLRGELGDLAEIGIRYGRDEQDRLVGEIADRITACLRPGDVAARAGEQEIVISLEGVPDLPDVLEIADDIRESVAAPYRLADGWIAPSLALGACLAFTGESFDAVMARAVSPRSAGG